VWIYAVKKEGGHVILVAKQKDNFLGVDGVEVVAEGVVELPRVLPPSEFRTPPSENK
jgi:hypothetical protein